MASTYVADVCSGYHGGPPSDECVVGNTRTGAAAVTDGDDDDRTLLSVNFLVDLAVESAFILPPAKVKLLRRVNR